MGATYKDNNKKKSKRKKGKKFVYRGPTQLAEKEEKKNPFEDMSKKKFMKQGKQYQGLIDEYQTRNNTNSFVDRRIGENSKHLSQDEKMKLRFKAQQMLNMKSKKNKFSLLNEENDEDNQLTHRGRIIDENENSDIEKSDDEEYYEKMDNYMEELDNNKDGKLSRKEIIQNIINKSKLLKEEKQKLKRDNKDKIEILDENFDEISSLLKKRGRTFSKFNDDYDRFASQFVYATKTHPTDRLRTDQEIEMQKEIKQERLNKKKMREEMENSDGEEEEDKDNNNKLESMEQNKLTKSERIQKLITDRLNKAGKVVKEDIISKRNKGDDEEQQDNLSDLEEFDEDNQQEEGEDDYDDEEGSDDNDDEADNEEGNDQEDYDQEDFNIDDIAALQELIADEQDIKPKKKRKFK